MRKQKEIFFQVSCFHIEVIREKHRMTSFSMEEISQRLSHTLDCLGCSPHMVRIRKNFYNINDKLTNSDETYFKGRTVGSRGEGLIRLFESDWDILLITNDALVIDDRIPIESISESVSVCLMIPCLLHPGHFRLLLLRQGTVSYIPETIFKPFKNGCWLSRKEFVSAYKSKDTTMSGPAQTINDPLSWKIDSVVSFSCICPSIIQQWINRPRRYDWPPIELRERISHMPANIVATGQKGCPYEETEWRLCFNRIELLLVDSWNDTQKKLYKVLKMIKKDVFVSGGFEVSSYMMKNILMWLSEAYPQLNFKTKYLMWWIIKSLRLLRKAVKVYNLPYYMIPDRNLISERIPRSQCKSLMREISDLIHCGPQLLWECKKLEFAMSMSPNELLYYKDRCDTLEILGSVRLFQGCYSLDNYKSETTAIVMNSKWPLAVKEKLKDKSGWIEILKVILG